MKRFLSIILATFFCVASFSSNLPFLTFETTDGTKASVPAEGLSISLSGNTLTAGGLSFTLTNLSKMYFSADDHTTAIQTIHSEPLSDVIEVYDLNGRKVDRETLTKGIFIVKEKDQSYKLVVR